MESLCTLVHDWAIVLAGGSGTRLATLTTDRHGVCIPKQYCSLGGDRLLLEDALNRAERVIASERIVIIVAEEHREYWEPLLSDRPVQNVIVQPRNRGTGPGILLPLLSILERDPRARIALFPSDHWVRREDILAQALRSALSAHGKSERGVTLLGISPDNNEHEYGWIVRGSTFGLRSSVQTFIEKPDFAAAMDLRGRGAVWNSFLLVAAASSLTDLFQRQVPELLFNFRCSRPHSEVRATAALYDRIKSVDFSRDVLQGSESFLQVQVVPPCGWTDLGTPPRVARCMERVAQRGRVPSLSEGCG